MAQLINAANQDIKVAETLGYGTKGDYPLLYESMDALKKSVNSAGFKSEWLKIKKSLSAFKNKMVH